MRLTIAQRQYIAFLALTLIVLLMTLGLANWNFESGFVAFMEGQEQQRLTRVGDDLLEEFNRSGGSWELVDGRLLNRLLSPRRPGQGARGPGLGIGPGIGPDIGPGSGSGPRSGPRPPPRLSPRGLSLDEAMRPKGMPSPDGVLPRDRERSRDGRRSRDGAMRQAGPLQRPGPPKGQRPGGPGAKGLSLNPPTGLYDQDGRYIAGAPDFGDEPQNVVIPLVFEGVMVGELRSLPRQQYRSAEESLFVQRQRNTKWMIGAASLLVAAFIAYLLSSSMQRPIRRMTDGITDLSNGNYDSALETSRTDELGRLMNDLHRLSTTLGEAQTARRRWLADISHELRTPIAALTAEIEALKDGVRSFGPDRLASLDAQTIRLRRLVEDLYELSLSDVGGLRYSYESVEMVTQVASVVDQVRDSAVGLKIHLVHAETLYINADPLRIDQLVNNLLSNAIAYTDTPGLIEVSLKRQDGRVVLEVADTPPGVTEVECERLFEPLYRRETARDRNRGGAGLGLAICKNIALAHQANIKAYPAAAGGLCVRIDFPLMRS